MKPTVGLFVCRAVSDVPISTKTPPGFRWLPLSLPMPDDAKRVLKITHVVEGLVSVTYISFSGTFDVWRPIHCCSKSNPNRSPSASEIGQVNCKSHSYPAANALMIWRGEDLNDYLQNSYYLESGTIPLSVAHHHRLL